MHINHFIKKVFSLFFSVVIMYACGNGTQEKEPVTTRDTSFPSVPDLVNEIAAYSTVDEEYVGFAGAASEQYRRFVRLTKQAPETELVALMNHTSANVRAYAFWALVKRNYPRLDSLLKDKMNDTASIRHFSGCINLQYPVRNFYSSVANRK